MDTTAQSPLPSRHCPVTTAQSPLPSHTWHRCSQHKWESTGWAEGAHKMWFAQGVTTHEWWTVDEAPRFS